LIKLGCAPLQFSSITRLIKELYTRHGQEHSTKTSSIKQIAQWLVCIDYVLEQQQQEHEQSRGGYSEKDESATINELKQLKIIPLRGQARLISMDEYNNEVILFPLPKINQYTKPFKIILDDISQLDERLLECIEAEFPRRYDSIVSLLRKLGITDKPKVKDIYHSYILPTLRDSTRYSSKSDFVLVAFLLCIYVHFNQFENDVDQLKKFMVIKTRNNQFIRLDTPGTIIHLTSLYGCIKSLECLNPPRHEFTYISDDYINNFRMDLFRTDQDIKNFVRFLDRLSVTEFLQTNITDIHYINVLQLQTTHWACFTAELATIICQPFIIEDCSCDEFNTLVAQLNNTTTDIDFCVSLLTYLDRHHPTLSKYYLASIISADQVKSGRRQADTRIPSTFCLSLRHHIWIPIEGNRLAKADDVYNIHPKSETLCFRRYVQHLDQAKLTLTNRSFVVDTLGLKEHVLPITMFELFMKWSSNLNQNILWMMLNAPNELELIPCALPQTSGQPCYETLDSIRRIYQFLISDNNTHHFLSRFRLWPLVFVPENNGKGRFLFPHQVYWHDPLSVLSNLNSNILMSSQRRISIQQYYNHDTHLQKFFLDTLQITLEPSIDDYLLLLTQILSINDLWRVIEVVIQLTFQQNRQLEIKERCAGLAFIPCTNQTTRRVTYLDRPYYPNNLDLANCLAKSLPIVQLPNWSLSSESVNRFCSL
ncbi:unnamed protein product, partial [Adineta ricciae]